MGPEGRLECRGECTVKSSCSPGSYNLTVNKARESTDRHQDVWQWSKEISTAYSAEVLMLCCGARGGGDWMQDQNWGYYCSEVLKMTLLLAPIQQ